ncbi:hypothetical protein FH972_023307 [Carpinus fangiana]|uniref:Telomeric repeat-binding factor 2-interacting protein 1 n=1 Tax=Carpinus fangiana TaxID=176857 RepID=A0A5N6KVB1_9ROSI|nr:hypothetical protein FH972_023307 [Carpinus fangiana]
MAAAVPDTNGGIFQGLKFFVALRVPQRSTFIQKLKEHGGEAPVLLEKNADILIADHARKQFAPEDALSYTWIDASIQQKRRVDEDEHRIGPPKGHVRPPGSQRPARGGREKFTDADDLFLYNWVKEAERNGMPLRGNELYKQLEATNRRHTLQSWRDRWIKYVSVRPPPVGAGGALPVHSPPPPPSTTPAQHPSSRKSSPLPPTSSAPERRQHTPPPPPSIPSKTGELGQNEGADRERSQPLDTRPAHEPTSAAATPPTTPRLASPIPIAVDEHGVGTPSHSDQASVREALTAEPSQPPDIERISLGNEQSEVVQHSPGGQMVSKGKAADFGTGQSMFDGAHDNPRSPELSASERSQIVNDTHHRPAHFTEGQPIARVDSGSRSSHSPLVTPLHSARLQEKANRFASFTDRDRDLLKLEAYNLVGMDPEDAQGAWEIFSLRRSNHTAQEWQDFWEFEVGPSLQPILEEASELEFPRSLPASRRVSAQFRVGATPDRTTIAVARHSAGSVLEAAASQLLNTSPSKRVRFGEHEGPSTQKSIEFDVLPNGERIVKTGQPETEITPMRGVLKRKTPTEDSSRGFEVLSTGSQASKKRRMEDIDLEMSAEDDAEEADYSDGDVEPEFDSQIAEFSVYQDDGIVEDEKENMRSSPMRPIQDDLGSEDRLSAFGKDHVEFVLVPAAGVSENDQSFEEEEDDRNPLNPTIQESSRPSQLQSDSPASSSDVFVDAAQRPSDLRSQQVDFVALETVRNTSTRPKWQDTQAFLNSDSLEADLDLPSPPPESDIAEEDHLPSVEEIIESQLTSRLPETPELESESEGPIFVPEGSPSTDIKKDEVVDEEADENDQNEIQSNLRRRLETQEILNRDTQDIDLSLPLPPSSVDSGDAASRQGTSPQPSEASSVDKSAFERWFEVQLWTDDRETIVQAAEIADANPKIAAQLLELWRRGKPTPSNMPGVWPPEHDEIILKNEQSGLRRLSKLHGRDRLVERQTRVALRLTDDDDDAAEELVRVWQSGRPTPNNLPGVWLPEHDEVLRGTDARAMSQLYKLHGRARCDYELKRVMREDADAAL